MSARVYFMKRVYSVGYCNFLVLLSTTVCSQNINKQNVNIADETLTGYSFLSRYHYTKSKNYLKRRYRIRQWIPMFIRTPCIKLFLKNHKTSQMRKSTKYLNIICFHSPGISTVLSLLYVWSFTLLVFKVLSEGPALAVES